MAYFIGLSGYSALWRWVCRCPVWLTAFRFLYASDFYRLGYIKDGSFCSGMRRPLRRPSEYTSWRSRSTVPPYMFSGSQKENVSLWVSVFHVRKKVLIEAYGLWHRPTQLLPADSALWRLGRQNMFFFSFTLIMVSFPPKLGHQNPLFSICVIHEKNKDGFNASGGH